MRPIDNDKIPMANIFSKRGHLKNSDHWKK